ncbi:MAG: hypothetical protein J6K25_12410 [Thermoguttaceae bacterium]|nr:hypothetical protein [Thermoguttaceae bacterium]
MTLAELLEKARDYPQNADVRAVVVDDEHNCYKPFFDVAHVYFDRDNTDQVYILLKK